MRCASCHQPIKPEEQAHDSGLDDLVHPGCCPECNPLPMPGQMDVYDVLADDDN